MSVCKDGYYRDEKIATHFLALFFAVLNSLVNNNTAFFSLFSLYALPPPFHPLQLYSGCLIKTNYRTAL